MTYPTLLRTHWSGFVRSFESVHTRPVSPGQAILGSYVAVVLLCSGLLFQPFFAPNHSPVHQLNRHLIGLLAGFVVIRFLFQKPPRLQPQHFLHLPVRRSRLIAYVQWASLGTVYNLFPLFFFAPFGLRYLPASTPLAEGVAFWIIGITCAILITHYAALALRVWLGRSSLSVLVLISAVIGLEMFDQMVGASVIQSTSAALFDGLLDGHWTTLLLLASVAAATYLIAGLGLWRALLSEGSSFSSREYALPVRLPFSGSVLRNLALLEVKMMWRSSRTRQYVLISIVVSTAYTALLLSDLNLFTHQRWMWALIGLFASGAFVLNYGQLMFAWESRYFDGMMARATPLDTMVQAKIMLLQGSCIALFLISLPLFIAMAPHLIPLHVAFLFYNAGITSALMILLAVHNHKRVDLTSGGFFEYEGFSAIHWLWMIPTVVPPALILMVLPDRTHLAFSLIALLGLAGMLLSWPWSQALARRLTLRKHTMAAGFRHTHD